MADSKNNQKQSQDVRKSSYSETLTADNLQLNHREDQNDVNDSEDGDSKSDHGSLSISQSRQEIHTQLVHKTQIQPTLSPIEIKYASFKTVGDLIAYYSTLLTQRQWPFGELSTPSSDWKDYIDFLKKIYGLGALVMQFHSSTDDLSRSAITLCIPIQSFAYVNYCLSTSPKSTKQWKADQFTVCGFSHLKHSTIQALKTDHNTKDLSDSLFQRDYTFRMLDDGQRSRIAKIPDLELWNLLDTFLRPINEPLFETLQQKYIFVHVINNRWGKKHTNKLLEAVLAVLKDPSKVDSTSSRTRGSKYFIPSNLAIQTEIIEHQRRERMATLCTLTNTINHMQMEHMSLDMLNTQIARFKPKKNSDSTGTITVNRTNGRTNDIKNKKRSTNRNGIDHVSTKEAVVTKPLVTPVVNDIVEPQIPDNGMQSAEQQLTQSKTQQLPIPPPPLIAPLPPPDPPPMMPTSPPTIPFKVVPISNNVESLSGDINSELAMALKKRNASKAINNSTKSNTSTPIVVDHTKSVTKMPIDQTKPNTINKPSMPVFVVDSTKSVTNNKPSISADSTNSNINSKPFAVDSTKSNTNKPFVSVDSTKSNTNKIPLVRTKPNDAKTSSLEVGVDNAKTNVNNNTVDRDIKTPVAIDLVSGHIETSIIPSMSHGVTKPNTNKVNSVTPIIYPLADNPIKPSINKVNSVTPIIYPLTDNPIKPNTTAPLSLFDTVDYAPNPKQNPPNALQKNKTQSKQLQTKKSPNIKPTPTLQPNKKPPKMLVTTPNLNDTNVIPTNTAPLLDTPLPTPIMRSMIEPPPPTPIMRSMPEPPTPVPHPIVIPDSNLNSSSEISTTVDSIPSASVQQIMIDDNSDNSDNDDDEEDQSGTNANDSSDDPIEHYGVNSNTLNGSQPQQSLRQPTSQPTLQSLQQPTSQQSLQQPIPQQHQALPPLSSRKHVNRRVKK